MKDLKVLLSGIIIAVCVQMSAAETISGTVIDGNGSPLADAKVIAVPGDDSESVIIMVKTGDDGAYSIDVDGSSKYLMITKRGYRGVMTPVSTPHVVLESGLYTNYPWLNAVVNNEFAWPKAGDADNIYVTYSKGEGALNFVFEFDDEWFAKNVDIKALRDIVFRFIITNMEADGDADPQTNLDMNIARCRRWLDITVSVGSTHGGKLRTKQYKCKDLIKFLRKDPNYTGLHK